MADISKEIKKGILVGNSLEISLLKYLRENWP